LPQACKGLQARLANRSAGYLSANTITLCPPIHAHPFSARITALMEHSPPLVLDEIQYCDGRGRLAAVWQVCPACGGTIKRIASKPKGYLADNGLACHLARITSPDALDGHPMAAPYDMV
jgi:hypothetical protein